MKHETEGSHAIKMRRRSEGVLLVDEIRFQALSVNSEVHY